jgi:HAMP domain-containing protein
MGARRQTLAFQLTAMQIAVIAVVLGFSSAFSFLYQREALTRDLHDRVNQIADNLMIILRNPMWNLDYGNIKSTVQIQFNDSNISRIEVIDNRQKTVVALRRAINGEIVHEVADPRTGEGYLFSLSRPIDKGSIHLADFTIYVSDAQLRQAFWNSLLLVVCQFLTVSLVTVAALHANLSRLVFRRLTQLCGVLHRFTRHEDIGAPPDARQDEIGELGVALHRMMLAIHDNERLLQDTVDKRTRELQERNASLTEANHYALRLQTSLLPDLSQDFGGMIDAAMAIWEPCATVGGDFYWIRRWRGACLVAVLDCTGHSVPGALMTVTVAGILERAVDEANHLDPAAILRLVDEMLRRALHQDNPDSATNDGADIGLCVVEPSASRLVFCGAGLDLIHCDASGCAVVPGQRASVGYRRNPRKREAVLANTELALSSPCRFYLASDGVLDLANPDGLSLGRRRLLALLSAQADREFSGVRAALAATLRQWRGGRPARDDLTLFGFEIRGAAGAAPQTGESDETKT